MTSACFSRGHTGFSRNATLVATVNPPALAGGVFKYFWFSFFQKILEEQAPESAQKNINLKILNELKVISPPSSLQKDFFKFVQQVEKAKSSVKQSLEKLETLKKSLMQEYFG